MYFQLCQKWKVKEKNSEYLMQFLSFQHLNHAQTQITTNIYKFNHFYFTITLKLMIFKIYIV